MQIFLSCGGVTGKGLHLLTQVESLVGQMRWQSKGLRRGIASDIDPRGATGCMKATREGFTSCFPMQDVQAREADDNGNPDPACTHPLGCPSFITPEKELPTWWKGLPGGCCCTNWEPLQSASPLSPAHFGWWQPGTWNHCRILEPGYIKWATSVSSKELHVTRDVD